MRSFPPRTIKTSIEAIRDSNAKTGATKIQKITFETVDAELGNGHFSVLGSNIATTGDGTNVHAGQQVPVGWNESAPAVIIDHHAQAAQGIRPLPAGGEVVEELFIATNPASGSLDVWFRNLSQVTPLGLTQFLASGSGDQATSCWWRSCRGTVHRDESCIRIARCLVPKPQSGHATRIDAVLAPGPDVELLGHCAMGTRQ